MFDNTDEAPDGGPVGGVESPEPARPKPPTSDMVEGSAIDQDDVPDDSPSAWEVFQNKTDRVSKSLKSVLGRLRPNG